MKVGACEARNLTAIVYLCVLLLACGSPSSPQPSATTEELNDAAASMGQFEFSVAESAFATLLQADPTNELLQFNVALARMNSTEDGSQSSALEQFRPLFARKEMEVRARYCAGLCLLYMGRPEESAPHFEFCAGLRPNDAYVAYFLGAALDAMEGHAEALVWFTKATVLEPRLKSAWLGVQRCARRTGDEVLAARALEIFEGLLEHPRALTAEFKYTRMGELALVALPGERVPEVASEMNFAECFTDAQSLHIENADPSAPELRWSSDARVSAVTVDLNLDNLQDIIVLRAFATDGTGLPPNAVLLATGRGGYALDRTHPAALVTDANALLIGDINNDTQDDLYFCRSEHNVLLMRSSNGGYEDATEVFGVSGSGQATVDGALADLDQDGDLDLFLVHEKGKNELLANNMDGTFRALGASEGLAFDERPSRQVLVTDLDSDRDVDIVVMKVEAPHEVWTNDRVWKWRRSSEPEWFLKHPAEGVVCLHDFEHATAALVTVSDFWVTRYPLGTRDWVMDPVEPAQVGGRAALSIADVDGDGRSEVLELRNAATRVRRGAPDPPVTTRALDGTLTTQDGSVTIPSPEGTLATCVLDLDATKGASMLYLRNGESPMIARPGSDRMAFAAFRLRGRDDPSQSMRSNASGIGALVAARVASHWTGATTSRTSSCAGQSLAPVPLGLGTAERADFLEIEWSDGVLQTERALCSGEVANIVETQRQLSSCPVLFAFNGSQMQFVSDLLGVGGLGYLLEPGVYSEPRPWEVFVLPQSALELDARGKYRIALAEPMEESCMLDAISLSAVDLPRGWDIAPDERLHISGTPPTGALVAWRQSWSPTTEPALVACDGVAKELPVRDGRFIGRLDSEASVDLSFGVDLPKIKDPWLVIDGWVEYPYCQTMFAAWQAGAKYRAPSLEARARDGTWVELVAEWGYPAGMPRRLALPIPSASLPEGCTQLRMRSNMEVYFDSIRLVEREPLPSAPIPLHCSGASLASVGFAKRTTMAQSRPFYDHAQPLPLWDCRFQRGLYSELGPVGELLNAEDDALVVFGPGEEVAIAFDPPEHDCAPGSTRRLMLRVRGWCKDMDLFTHEGETIEPIPTNPTQGSEAAQMMQESRTRRMGGR